MGRTHELRGNPVGADRLLQRAVSALAPYVDAAPHDIDAAGLRAWAQNPNAATMPRLRRTRHNDRQSW